MKATKKIFEKLYNMLTKEIVSYVSVGKISILNSKLLDNVYEEMKSKWLYNSSLGEEALLLDDCVLWSGEIINLMEENKYE